MKLSIGSDHAGYQMKEGLKKFLESKSIEVIDCGPDTDAVPAEYVLIARETSLKVSNKEVDSGILICGTGVGMSIAANKVPGIRAAVCNELFTAKYSKSDVNLNMLCMGARVISQRMAEEIATVWLETEFTGGRFIPRIQKVSDLEEEMRKSAR
jgi:ribose 5-phosphate isomerase B